MAMLGVNIDHVATLRQVRRAREPRPLLAARECLAGGCHSIVVHLREDRRHINDADVASLRRIPKLRLNLEMSIAREILEVALRIAPDQATLVPERRMELTTEGGLDVVKNEARIKKAVSALRSRGIDVSLFIDPSAKQIDASVRAGAGIIELHTGEYANAKTAASRQGQLKKLKRAAAHALKRGLEVNAGHGLDYINVRPVARIPGMHELNIGHSIVSRAVFTGIRRAVSDMVRIIG